MGKLAYAQDQQQAAVQAVGDEILETKVERRLRMEGRIRFDSLKVEASNGKVTLYGIVKSNEEREWATKAASTVPEVVAIHNELLVQPESQPGDKSTDARITETTRDRVIEGPAGVKDRQILP
ncbi:MAG: hypothetical protein A4E19_19985 [Nitrospira sp. SG-bin1]|nr:MAG: hypothetical protein A4E19_19985 [Nitrospira sp. SG-bin1]